MTDEAKPSVLSVLQNILTTLSGGTVNTGGGTSSTVAIVKPYLKTVTDGALDVAIPIGMYEVSFAVTPQSTSNATISTSTGNITLSPGMSITIPAGDAALSATYPITYTCTVATCTLLIVGSQGVAA